MDWKFYSKFQWNRGMRGNGKEFIYCVSEVVDANGGVFFILPHYNKAYDIKKYSVWFQDSSHVSVGGDNFALKIKSKCVSFEEGKKIAEDFYTRFRSGQKVKFVGTQMIDDDTYIDGAFCQIS